MRAASTAGSSGRVPVCDLTRRTTAQMPKGVALAAVRYRAKIVTSAKRARSGRPAGPWRRPGSASRGRARGSRTRNRAAAPAIGVECDGRSGERPALRRQESTWRSCRARRRQKACRRAAVRAAPARRANCRHANRDEIARQPFAIGVGMKRIEVVDVGHVIGRDVDRRLGSLCEQARRALVPGVGDDHGANVAGVLDCPEATALDRIDHDAAGRRAQPVRLERESIRPEDGPVKDAGEDLVHCWIVDETFAASNRLTPSGKLRGDSTRRPGRRVAARLLAAACRRNLWMRSQRKSPIIGSPIRKTKRHRARLRQGRRYDPRVA